VGPLKKQNWHKACLGDEDDAQTLNTHKYMHSAEKSCNTAFDDEKCGVCYRHWERPIGKNMSDGT